MKKSIIFTLLLTAFAVSAYATDNGSALIANKAISNNAAQIFGGVDEASAKAATTPLIKLSNGVKALVNAQLTEYVIMTKHDSGSKTFGTAGDTTSIFWTQEAKGALTADKAIATNAANFTAENKWTAQ